MYQWRPKTSHGVPQDCGHSGDQSSRGHTKGCLQGPPRPAITLADGARYTDTQRSSEHRLPGRLLEYDVIHLYANTVNTHRCHGLCFVNFWNIAVMFRCQQ